MNKIIIIILIAFSVISCTKVESRSNSNITIEYRDDDRAVYSMTLNDGTKCVIYEGYKRGGVSCDF